MIDITQAPADVRRELEVAEELLRVAKAQYAAAPAPKALQRWKLAAAGVKRAQARVDWWNAGLQAGQSSQELERQERQAAFERSVRLFGRGGRADVELPGGRRKE